MSFFHLILILIVILVWGCNFIFVTLSLHELPPLLLCAIRFLLASFPAILFIKKPDVSFKLILMYGLFMFGAQFALLFMGMKMGMTPGLASILMQVQVFCSIFLAALFLDEIPSVWQMVGAGISCLGIGVVAMHVDKTLTLVGLVLVIASAVSCGFGNLITKKMGRINMIALVVWGSFIAFWPLLILSFIFEGFNAFSSCLPHMTWVGVMSVLYIVYASTWIGYGIWNWLISRYSVANVAPFTLMVPVVAMISSVLILGESFQSWKLLAGLLVITGLGVNIIAGRWAPKKIVLEAEI